MVPVSRHLNLMEREGVYSPYSGIFSMNEPAHGYQWWSIVPRLSRDDLFRAEVVDDSYLPAVARGYAQTNTRIGRGHNGRGENSVCKGKGTGALPKDAIRLRV